MAPAPRPCLPPGHWGSGLTAGGNSSGAPFPGRRWHSPGDVQLAAIVLAAVSMLITASLATAETTEDAKTSYLAGLKFDKENAMLAGERRRP